MHAGSRDVNGLNGVSEQCSVYYALRSQLASWVGVPHLEMTRTEGSFQVAADPIKPRNETKQRFASDVDLDAM